MPETVTLKFVVFEGLAGYDAINVTLLGRGIPERISGTRVTASFFSVLGVQPFLGRGYQPEDGHLSSAPVALISYEFWQCRFGGDRTAVGQVLNLPCNLQPILKHRTLDGGAYERTLARAARSCLTRRDGLLASHSRTSGPTHVRVPFA